MGEISGKIPAFCQQFQIKANTALINAQGAAGQPCGQELLYLVQLPIGTLFAVQILWPVSVPNDQCNILHQMLEICAKIYGFFLLRGMGYWVLEGYGFFSQDACEPSRESEKVMGF